MRIPALLLLSGQVVNVPFPMLGLWWLYVQSHCVATV
jgi:hypothetical protein